jgi:glycosyltransferase involved in cell wall biosynthesis
VRIAASATWKCSTPLRESATLLVDAVVILTVSGPEEASARATGSYWLFPGVRPSAKARQCRDVRTLLVVSNDHVGSSMAGPGIRSYELARRLTRRFAVTLAVPFETDVQADGFALTVVSPQEEVELTTLASGFDAVLAQRLPLLTMIRLARTCITRVYDLYAPVSIELLASLAAEPGQAPSRELVEEEAITSRLVLQSGSAFVCASETQRDYWLGRLEAVGRLDADAYALDPSLRSLIDVVPFGLSSERPQSGPALKGVVPGIGPDDRVVLWNGGIWNWFDPVTVIRGIGELTRRRDDVRLVFMGTRHPNPTIAQRARAEEAVRCARELGLLDRVVFFNDGWVPYAERGAYLLDADVGVSAHRETFEARLAFRTRVLDCLWAELPVVVTAGDALADLVERRGLGRTVGVGDVTGWADALGALLDDGPSRKAARAALNAERTAFEWDAVVERLVPLLERPGTPLDVPDLVSQGRRQLVLRARRSLRYRGPIGFAKRLTWHAGRVARARARGGFRSFD